MHLSVVTVHVMTVTEPDATAAYDDRDEDS